MFGEEMTVDVTYDTKQSLLMDGIYWENTSSQLSAATVFHRIACGSTKLSQVDDILSTQIAYQERLKQHLSRIIYRLNDLILANPLLLYRAKSEIPLSVNFWITLSKLEADEVVNILLHHIPQQVQEFLGRPNVTANDLLALPSQDNDKLTGWIVYIDVITDKEGHTLGSYVGSATGQGGGLQRWSEYDRYIPNNLSKDDYSRKGYHHWFATRPGRIMNLRAIALGFCPLNSTFWPLLTERVFMVLLGSLSNGGQRKQFTPQAMLNWYEACREAIPGVGRFSDTEPLNRSWSLRQGFRKCIQRPTTCPHCGRTPLTKSIWLRTEAKYVCPSCWERSFKRQEKRRLVKDSGQGKCGRLACEWKFGPYIDLVKKERPGVAPKAGISDTWLCQPCFSAAVRTAKALGIQYVKVRRGLRAKQAGIAHCQNVKCKRPLGRNKMKNERPAERPRPGISDLWLCINCFRKARRGTLDMK